MRVASLFVLLSSHLATAAAQEAPTREVGDYNFDGHMDYRDPAAAPGNRCGWWDYYLYDASSGQHRAVDTAFCGEVFEAAEELVKTYSSGGMAGYLFSIRHFRWEGVKPVAVFVETQEYDEARDVFIRTRIWNLDALGGPSASTTLLTRDEVTSEFESRK
jgi:hypothetical protein